MKDIRRGPAFPLRPSPFLCVAFRGCRDSLPTPANRRLCGRFASSLAGLFFGSVVPFSRSPSPLGGISSPFPCKFFFTPSDTAAPPPRTRPLILHPFPLPSPRPPPLSELRWGRVPLVLASIFPACNLSLLSSLQVPFFSPCPRSRSELRDCRPVFSAALPLFSRPSLPLLIVSSGIECLIDVRRTRLLALRMIDVFFFFRFFLGFFDGLLYPSPFL